jgi:uncharacterized membrane protein (UPF0127 family)
MKRFIMMSGAVGSLFLFGCDPGSESDFMDTEAQLPPRGYAWVIFGNDTITAEIADTPQTRERGLMFRDELPDDEGMLFIFDGEAVRSFWMENTFIPLDIAFIDRTLAIVDIRQMQPQTQVLHTSSAPAMYALEVPQGQLATRGITVGQRPRIVFGAR